MGSNLEDDTDNVDTTANDNSVASTNQIGGVTSDECAKESTSGEDRDDQRVVRTAESCSIRAFDDGDEDGRASDTIDVSRVITEEDTAEGGERAEEVRLPGNRRLDHLQIGCSGHGASTALPDGIATFDILLVEVLLVVEVTRGGRVVDFSHGGGRRSSLG